MGRVEIERRPVHILDALADPDYQLREHQRIGGFRTMLGVPMLREDMLAGVFFLSRREVEAFTEKQIELVSTFADQAVIAIENVRLLQELQDRNRQLTESLEQQTATSEILGVIASSPTDIQPVLDVVAENAARLCEALNARIFRVEGERLRLAAQYGSIPTFTMKKADRLSEVWPEAKRSSIERPFTSGRFCAKCSDRVSRNLGTDPRGWCQDASCHALAPRRNGIGSIMIRRTEVGPFTDKQIALLKTFADQAVIAIENVRLVQGNARAQRGIARGAGASDGNG